MRISIVALMVALGAAGYLHRNSAAQPAAEAGKKSFETRCAPCHSVRGRGGIRGPDLSDVGARRTVAEIERSLREPDSEVAPGFKTASVRLRDGRRLRGLIKNESNYDLQLQSLDGLLASLR